MGATPLPQGDVGAEHAVRPPGPETAFCSWPVPSLGSAYLAQRHEQLTHERRFRTPYVISITLLVWHASEINNVDRQSDNRRHLVEVTTRGHGL